MPKRLIPFKNKFAKLVATGALLTSLVNAPAVANPSGASVQSGQVNITGGAGSMTVQQFTDRAIIDWQKFGVGAGESLQFLQPGQLSVILNRVVGQDPTQILGQMSANGNVWIINPNGVLFGPQSQVNVGGLLASTLNISNEDFLNGNYRFTQDQNKALASVVNQGSITITDGGYAILMAPLVSNEGMIVANLGQVNLMSGESATLNFDGRNLISYDIGHLDSAEPGTVVVDRSTVSALLANVIQDPNLTEAGGIVENDDGSVSLVGAAGTVLNSGSIQANGADGQRAGKVVLDSGRLTVLGEGSSTEASGQGADSDGGEIIALSHGTMKFSEGATLEAKGGDVSGDGGFIDTSGYGRIILEDYADASATDGESGEWLIDPNFLTIVDEASGSGALDGSTDTTGLGGPVSTISVGYLEGLTAGTSVTLQADILLTIADLAGDQTINFQDDVDVTLRSTLLDVVFADPNDAISIGGTGNLTIESGRDITLGKLVSEGTGTIDLTAGGNITAPLDGSTDLATSSGQITVDAGGDFQADVFGVLEIGSVLGNVDLGVDSDLNLNFLGPGTIGGDFSLDNDGTTFIGDLRITGDARFTNSGQIGNDEFLAETDLTASTLEVVNDAAMTALVLDVDVDSLLLDDDNLGAGAGSFLVFDADNLDSVIVQSLNSDVSLGTSDGGSVTLSSGVVNTGVGMDVGAITLSEASGDVEIETGNFSNARGTDVTITATAGEIFSSDTLTTLGNATFHASGAIGASGTLDTNVAGTLSITSDTGTIDFTDSHTDGPADLFVRTGGGRSVTGSWDGNQSRVTYASSQLTILDLDAADTNVTFQTDMGDIAIDLVDVGDFEGGDTNDVSLVATAGDIYDLTDPGFSISSLPIPNLMDSQVDVRGANVSLIAGGRIGNSLPGLDLEVGESILTNSGGDTLIDIFTTSSVSIAGMTAGGDLELTTAGGVQVDGEIQSADLLCLDVSGDLEVNADLISTGGNIALRATGDLTVGNDNAAVGTAADQLISLTDDQTISLEAGGDVIDNNGEGNAAALAAGDASTVVVIADRVVATDDGDSTDTDAFEIEAGVLSGSARGGINGGDFVVDDLTGDLTIQTRSTIKGAVRPTSGDGVNAVDDTSVEVLQGSLFVNSSLYAGDDVSLKADQDVTLGGTGRLDGLVSAGSGDDLGFNDSDDVLGTVNVEAVNGSILDGNGDELNIVVMGDAATTTAGNVVLTASGGIGSDASGDNDDALELDTLTLSAVAGAGDVNVISEDEYHDDGLTITGVSAGRDVSIEVQDNDLRIDENVIAGHDLSISSDGFIRLGDTVGATRGVLVAGVGSDGAIGGGDDVTATVSLETGVAIIDGNGDDTIDGDGDGFADGANIIALGDGTVDSGGNVVLDAVYAVGDATLDDAVEVDTLVLAVASDFGDVLLAEQDLVSQDGLTIGELTTGKGGVTVTGVTTSDAELSIDVESGSLRIYDDVSADMNALYLSADGDITIGNDPTAVGSDADQVIAGIRAILEAGGDIIDNNGSGNRAVDVGFTILVAGGSVGDVQFSEGNPAAGDAFELNGSLVADVAGELNVRSSLSLGIASTSYTDRTGTSRFIDGVRAGQDIQLEAGVGPFAVNAEIVSTNGSVALKSFSDVELREDITAANTISIEAGRELSDESAFGGTLTANNVILDTEEGIGANPGGFEVEVDAANLAAVSRASGDINIEATNSSGTEINVDELNTLISGNAVTGIDSAGALNLFVEAVDLQISEDVSAQSGAAYLQADGNITVGDGDADQVTGSSRVILEAGGDIVDNNGDNVAAAVAVDRNVILVADGSIGDVQFNSGAPAGGSVFEVDAIDMAAQAGTTGDVNILDLSLATSAADLTYVDKDGTSVNVSGVSAGQDISLDSVGGDFILPGGVRSSNGSVSIRNQGVGDQIDISRNIAAADTLSIESAGEIRDSGNTNVISATNIVLDAVGGIGDHPGTEILELLTENLAVRNVTSGQVDIVASNPVGNTVSVVELATLKSGNTISGIAAAESLSLEIENNDNLQVDEDITAGTAGAASTIDLQLDGNIVIGDGTSGGAQIRNATADTSNVVGLFAGSGTLEDNNGDGVAAVDANGGDVGVGAFTIGTTDFAGSSTLFEIDANRFAAISGDDINVRDLDTNADGLDITALTLPGGSLNGATATNDLSLDVVNGDLNILSEVTGVGGSVALRTQNADGGGEHGDIILGEDIRSGNFDPVGTVSLEAAGRLNASGSFSISGQDVVLSTEDGIGTTGSEIVVDSSRLAARSDSGDVNIRLASSTGDTVSVTELSTLLGGESVVGIEAAGDICLDVFDILVVEDNIVSGNDLAVRSNRNIQLGDTTGPTRGVLVAGVGADGAIGGGDDVTATVSVEAGGRITDGNGDDTTDSDGDGFADGANIIALGDGINRSGGNVVLDADGVGVLRTTVTDSIEIDTQVVAASADSGEDVNLVEQDLVTNDGLTVGELTTLKGNLTVTGVSAGDDICIEVANGTLDIQENVQANNDLFLEAGGNVILAADVEGGDSTGSSTGITSESGDIVNAGGTVTSQNLALSAGDDIGVDASGATAPLSIEARTLAAVAGDDISLVQSRSQPLSVESSRRLKTGSISGITAGGDLDLSTDGTLTVESDIQTTGEIYLDSGDLRIQARIESTGGNDIALHAHDEVWFENGADDWVASNGGTISVEASVLRNNNGANLDLDAGAGLIVLHSPSGIGGIQISAAQLAAFTASSDLNITSVAGDLEIVEATTLIGDRTVTGVESGNHLDLTVENGSLDIQENIVADLDLTLQASDDIVLGASVETGTLEFVGITAVNGDIVNDGGAIESYELLLSAGGSIGVDSSGVASPISFDATVLAAQAGKDISLSSTGGVQIDSVIGFDGIRGGGNLELLSDSGNVLVNEAIRVMGDICLDVDELRLSNDLESTGGGNIAISADSDVLLGDGSGDTVTSNGGTISIEAGGDVDDRNGDNLDLDAGDGLLVIHSGGQIEGLEIAASQLAVRASDGQVEIDDIDSNDLDIVEATTLKGGVVVTGVSTPGTSVTINVSGGSLNVQEDVVSLRDITLTASEDVVVGAVVDGGFGVDDEVRITAQNGSIVDDGGSVEALSVVLSAGDDIGVNASGTASPLELSTSFLAVSAGNDINLTSTGGFSTAPAGSIAGIQGGGDLTLSSGGRVFVNEAIRMGGDVCLDANILDLREDVESTGGGDIAIRTGEELLLGNGSDDAVLSNGGTISVEAGGSITDRNGDNMDLDSDGGLIVLNADGGIGGTGAGEEVEIGAAQLAASASDGDVAVKDIDSGGLSITEATTLKGDVVVTGVSASDDISIEVENGNLGVGRDIQSGGDIFLEANNVYLNAEIIGGTGDTDQIGITARTGDIGQTNNAGIRGNSLALSAGDDIGLDVGFGDTVLGIDASEVAAEAGGFIRIEKLGGGDLTVAENLSLKSGTVSGLTAGEELELTTDEGLNVEARVQAADEISLDVGGTLTLSEDVESTGGGDIAIRTGDDVLLGDGNDDAVFSNGGTISVEAGGSITDRNGDNMDLDSDGGLIVLNADGGIGDTAAGEEIEIGAARLAASAADGNVAVTDIDSDGLSITEATTLKGDVVVTGVSASDDISIEVENGNLGVGRDIQSGGDIFLEANNVYLNAEIIGGTDDTDQIGITARTGDIGQTNNAGIRGNSVALSAGDDIGLDVGFGDTVLGIDASEVAAEAGGFIRIEKLGGGDLTVAENLNLKSGTVSGLTAGEELELTTDEGLNVEARVQAADEICLDVGGVLALSEDVESTGGSDIAIRAGGDVLLGDGSDDAVLSNGGTISLEAGGSMVDRNGDGMDLDSDGSLVVLDAEGGIGGTAAGEEIEISAAQLAAAAGAGDVAISDIDSGHLEIVESTTLKGGVDVAGVTASESVGLDVVNGTLSVNADIAADADIALRTQDFEGNDNGDIILGNGSSVSGNRISLEVDDTLVDNTEQTDAGAALVARDSLVIASGGSIGGAGAPLQVEAAGLAASSEGDIDIADLSGDLQITEETTIQGGVSVDGLNAAGDVCLEVLGGDLDLAQQVKAENVALRASGSVTLSGSDDVSANRQSGTVSVEAGDQIDGSGTGRFTARDVVFKAATGVGHNSPVSVEADNLAVDGGTGRVEVRDTAEGLRVAELQTLKGGDIVTGITAAQDVSLDVVGGNLVIDEAVSSGTVVAVRADGSIASNATVSGLDKVSVKAGGDITDGLSGEGPGNENFRGSDVVVRAGGNIGSSAEDLDIDSDRLAATGNNVYLEEVRGDMNIAELNLEGGGGTIAGVIAADEVALTADDGTIDTALRIQAGNKISIRTRDTLVIESPLATNPDGKVSVEVRQGGIESRNAGTDIETGSAVLKASEDIGSSENPIRTSVDMLAVQSTNGSVNIAESNGLKLKAGELAGGGAVEGGRAGRDFNLTVENGDLELANITAGNNVNLSVPNGDLVDCNGDDSNINAGGDVDISAPEGYVGVNQDQLEISAGGKVTIVQTDMGRDDADPIVLPPGVFAQNNVKLGESSFYLDVLYGWQTTDELILITEELEQSNY